MLDAGQAKRIVALAIEELKKTENEIALKEIVKECDMYSDNPMQQFQIKMQKLIPRVMEILGSQIEAVVGGKIEPQSVMNYVSQIQKIAATDVHLGIQVGKIIQTLSGDFTRLYEEDAEDEVVEQID